MKLYCHVRGNAIFFFLNTGRPGSVTFKIKCCYMLTSLLARICCSSVLQMMKTSYVGSCIHKSNSSTCVKPEYFFLQMVPGVL